MILTSAPLRVSLLGGGSDIPSYFQEYPGYVLGGSINKFVYVNLLPLSKFAPEKYRFTYRLTESVLSAEEIKHPVVRAILQELDYSLRLNLSTMADLPGNTGLGSSSAFVVSLVSAIRVFQGLDISPETLAAEAVRIERDKLREPGGVQDQWHSALGGFRLYSFEKGGVKHSIQLLDEKEMELLSRNTLLIKVGSDRISDAFTNSNYQPLEEKIKTTKEMAQIARYAADELLNARNFDSKLRIIKENLIEGWKLKNSILENTHSDDVISAIGKLESIKVKSYKLLGAGKSGFMLVVGTDNDINKVRQVFPSNILENFKFISRGVKLHTKGS